MAKQGKHGIAWTDETWNPVRGCDRVSAGCENCYAERMAARFSGQGQPYEGLTRMTLNGPRWTGKIRLVPEALDLPQRWKKPRRIFVNSMSDLFHEGVPDEFIGRIFAVMMTAKQHTFQILTKRPQRMHEWLVGFHEVLSDNIWLGVSVEDQPAADERIPWLLKTSAAVLFVSYEPALGPVDFSKRRSQAEASWTDSRLHSSEKSRECGQEYKGSISMIITGGESGPAARPSHPDWFREVRDACVAAGIPFFFKQWGEWTAEKQNSARDWGVIDHAGNFIRQTTAWNGKMGSDSPTGEVYVYRIGKKAAGHILDGREWQEFPA